MEWKKLFPNKEKKKLLNPSSVLAEKSISLTVSLLQL